MSEVIDGEVIEEHAGELVPVQHHGTGIQVAPEVTATDLIHRLDVIRDAMRNAMEKDIDYGVIPGTGSKPTLLKPGSEKLGVLFQLDIEVDSEKIVDGEHLTVWCKAIAYHAPTGTRLGSGEGMCSTREAKYAWRRAERLCPECNEPQVREGKPRDGRPGNWYCWKKQGGCGATWALDSDQGKTFKTMETGRMPNPDIFDQWNTVLKMAEKRARIDAVLAVTGASALFTQDVGDDDTRRDDPPPAPEVRIDGHEPAKRAHSWKDWEARMVALELPDPMLWLQAAAEATGFTNRSEKAWGRTLSQKANQVLLHFSDTEPASTIGFWSIPEIQAGYALAFDGAIIDPPEKPKEES